jgi:protein-tyrosine phosphatase
VRAWQQAGIEMIVSLLTKDEVAALELTQEAELCRKHGLQFMAFPISRQQTLDFVRKLDGALTDGKSLLIHCRQGIGRAALIAACLLVLSSEDAETAFQRVSAAQGVSVPETSEQRK